MCCHVVDIGRNTLSVTSVTPPVRDGMADGGPAVRILAAQSAGGPQGRLQFCSFSCFAFGTAQGTAVVTVKLPSVPNRRRLPSNRRRLPSNRRRLPSNCRRLPSNRRRLPSNRRRLPSNRRRLPSNRRRLPSNHRRLPSSCPRLTLRSPPSTFQPLSVALQPSS